jgi:hypothetical protein
MKSEEILIAEVTPDISHRLQQLALRAGYDWQLGFAKGNIRYVDSPFLAAKESEKRLYRSSFRQTPWGVGIREVSIKELTDLFTKELVLDCTIPEGALAQ